jgi:hypothetical protein
MWGAFFFAAIWVSLAFDAPGASTKLGVASMALSYIIVWYVPIWFKHRHVKSQNKLLDRCRALLILGCQAFEAGDKAGEKILSRIRRLEGLWRIGNSIPFRVSLAVWAIAWGIAACVLIRFLGILVVDYGYTRRPLPADVGAEFWLVVLISASAPIYALLSYFEAWINPWVIDNCGDRLWQFMFGPRAVEIAPDKIKIDVPDFDGMTPREIFGMGLRFTRRELDKARRRLVQEMHPDRWHHASVFERTAREEALKRVNAAYDVLSPLAAWQVDGDKIGHVNAISVV